MGSLSTEMLFPPPLLRRLSQECAVSLPGLHRQEADDPLRRMQRLGVPRLHGQEADNLLCGDCSICVSHRLLAEWQEGHGAKER